MNTEKQYKEASSMIISPKQKTGRLNLMDYRSRFIAQAKLISDIQQKEENKNSLSEGLYNPTQLQALTYSSGADILVAHRQEKYLPMQFKRLIPGKLNVVGENHSESSKRRKEEKEIAKHETGGEYWTEQEFRIGEPSIFSFFGDKREYADSTLLLVNQNASICVVMLESFIKNYIDDPILDKEGINEIMNDVLSSCEQALLHHQRFQKIFSKKLPISVPLYELYKTIKEITKKSTTIDKTKIMLFLSSIRAELHNKSFDEISKERTNYMEKSAKLNENKIGVWKIGDQHIRDWNSKDEQYALFTREEFNMEYFVRKYHPWRVDIFDTISNEDL